jgi:hypothetical protein
MNDATYNALNCTLGYLYWTAPGKIVRDVYGEDCHPSYRAEKERLVHDLSRFWGALDCEHRLRLCKAAMEYGVQRGLVLESEVEL